MSGHHYVARIVVQKVDTSPPPNDPKVNHREVSEVGNLLIKSEDLNSLVKRLKAHLDLMEDDL